MLPIIKLVISAGCELLLRAQQLEGVESLFNAAVGILITRSGSTEVRRVVFAEGTNQRALFLKRYWANGSRQLLAGMFRGTFFARSKVQREYENLARLRSWGLPAPRPVAYGEERHARWLRRSFLLSESVPNPHPLDLFIRDDLPAMPPAERRQCRRELITRLAEQTRHLHEHRFVHHDYFWRNIILSGHSLDAFYVIDAHKGRRWWPWQANRSRAKDLATLDAPAPLYFRRTERLRFFLAYRERTRLTATDKRLIRSALALAAPIRAKQEARVRIARPSPSASDVFCAGTVS